MCTLTALVEATGPRAGALRVAFNRDEKTSRPIAMAPRRFAPRRAGDVESCSPVDPASGGTWIACNAAGIVFALLNVNRSIPPRPRPGTDRLGACVESSAGLAEGEGTTRLASRGFVVPSIAGAPTLADALDRLREHFDTDAGGRHAPFRVLAIDARSWWECLHDAGASSFVEGAHAPGTPLFRTSSSAPGGDEAVLGPRSALLKALRERGGDWMRRLHSWSDVVHGERGVLMRRADARTVSVAWVESDAASTSLRYFPDPEGFARDGLLAPHVEVAFP